MKHLYKKLILMFLVVTMLPVSGLALTEQEEKALLLELLKQLIEVRRQNQSTVLVETEFSRINITSPRNFERVEYGGVLNVSWDVQKNENESIQFIFEQEYAGSYTLSDKNDRQNFNIGDGEATLDISPFKVGQRYSINVPFTLSIVRASDKKVLAQESVMLVDREKDSVLPRIEIGEVKNLRVGDTAEIEWSADYVEGTDLWLEMYQYNRPAGAKINRLIKTDMGREERGVFKLYIPDTQVYEGFKNRNIRLVIYTSTDSVRNTYTDHINNYDPLAVSDTQVLPERSSLKGDLTLLSPKPHTQIPIEKDFVVTWDYDGGSYNTFINVNDSFGIPVVRKRINLADGFTVLQIPRDAYWRLGERPSIGIGYSVPFEEMNITVINR